MKKRVLALLLCATMLLSLSGCSFVNLDVETQLRAPHAAGEQSAIQTALEQHIYNSHAQTADSKTPSYVLKYPRMGEYRSAFIMKDIDGDKIDDALAFYALQPEGAKTHIALLKKVDGTWVCVEDIEGLATEVERITFGDLNGDGAVEMMAGFSMYDTRDHRLMLYSWSNGQLISNYSDTYTHMIVGSVVKDTCDDLLLFRLNTENKKTTVRLLSMQNGTIVEKGTTQLDGHILQFGDYTFTTLDKNVRGVFQDCRKDLKTTITELVVWDGQALTAPLYDPVNNITSLSARESDIPAMDFDRDGEMEWSRSYRFPGDEYKDVSEVSVWLSEWYSWDHAHGIAHTEQTNITNLTDGYYITIPERWVGNITASYDQNDRCLTVKFIEDDEIGVTLFKIVAFSVGEEPPYPNENYLFLDSTNEMRYEIQYQKDAGISLSMDLLSELFVTLETEE